MPTLWAPTATEETSSHLPLNYVRAPSLAVPENRFHSGGIYGESVLSGALGNLTTCPRTFDQGIL